MAKKRTKTRVGCKMNDLPEEVRLEVDIRLADTSNTYESIACYLKEQGYEISRSAVGRYAIRSNSAIQRLLEAKAQTEKLVQIVQKNPDADYTEAAMVMFMDGLVNKIATAEEEFDMLPLDKAGRLIASLSRTKVYKDRVRLDMQKKADIAFMEMEERILKVIKQDGEAAAKLKDIIKTAKERMMQDD